MQSKKKKNIEMTSMSSQYPDALLNSLGSQKQGCGVRNDNGPVISLALSEGLQARTHDSQCLPTFKLDIKFTSSYLIFSAHQPSYGYPTTTKLNETPASSQAHQLAMSSVVNPRVKTINFLP